jgi:cell fate regulator YaaT (PSP1 superfamily)
MKEESAIVNNHFFSRGCCKPPAVSGDRKCAYKAGCSKLDVHDWLEGIPSSNLENRECVEVRFKNSRKEFFQIPPDLRIEKGDIVAVEAMPGHDIGIVTMTGKAVLLQMKKKSHKTYGEEIKKVYRRARISDIEKWIVAVDLEDLALLRSKEIAAGLDLVMKINDVEYQGDGTKAIFYYTAEDRVDFRELIKVLADKFRVRIEMKQIGARQEAARLGGIGSCGRELCCATWLTGFRSVSTFSARLQQLSLNPQKLAGQCSKLKCCLNFENPHYLEAIKDFPPPETIIKTKKGEAAWQKADIFKKIIWYSYTVDPGCIMPVSLEKAWELIRMNEKNVIPEQLEDFTTVREQKREFEDGVGQDDLNRFDYK